MFATQISSCSILLLCTIVHDVFYSFIFDTTNCDDLQLPSLSFFKQNMLHFSSQKLLIYSEESFLTQKKFSAHPEKNLCSLYSACVLSCFSFVQLFVTSWTIAHQGLLSTGYSRQEYQSRLPFLPPGNLPNLGIEPVSLSSPALASSFFTTTVTWEALGTNPVMFHSSLKVRKLAFPNLSILQLKYSVSKKANKKISVF